MIFSVLNRPFYTRVSLLIALTLLTGTTCAQLERGIQDFRPYEQIVDSFFASYSDFASSGPYSHVEFARKPDGWYVQQKNYGDTAAADVLYCPAGGSFVDLGNYFKTSADLSPEFTNSLSIAESASTRRQFHIHTFYGYRGWGEDIVKVLEPQTDHLNESDLYSLARACSNIAMSITSNDLGATRHPRVVYLPGGNSLDPQNLERYYSYHRRSLQYFKQLSERNPNFKTIVGDIRTKYANETMQGYLDMLIYQSKAEALSNIVAGAYPPDMLTHARNMLNGCPENALFLSFGDNDYYVLHYLQQVEGFRTDVLVVNYSLLSSSDYLQMIQKEYGLHLQLPMSFYRNMILLRSDGTGTLDWAELSDSIQPYMGMKGQYRMRADRLRTPDGLVLKTQQKFFKYHLALIDLYVSNPDRLLCGSSRQEPLDLFVEHLTSIGYLWEVRPGGPTVDTQAALAYFRDVDTTTYQDPAWMRKTEQGEYVNPNFLQNMFRSILLIMCYEKRNDSSHFNELNAIYEEWKAHWIVPPGEEILNWYSAQCE